MKKRMILIVVGVLVLVALCAGLPGLTSMFMDKQAQNAPVFNDIHPVEQISDTDTLTMLERLWLYSNGKSVDIKPANATKTEAEIKKCVEAFLSPCRAAGIYQDVTFLYPAVTTKLIYDVDDPSQTMIIWEYYATNFQTTADGQYFGETWAINVIVDDETGKVLSIRVDHHMVDEETGKVIPVQFDHYNVSHSIKDIWERNKKRIEPLEKLYFAQLGWTEQAEAAKASPQNYEYLERDTGVTEMHYTFADSTHGVKINLFVSDADTFRITVEKLKA